MKKLIVIIMVLVIVAGGLYVWKHIGSKNTPATQPPKQTSSQVLPVSSNPIHNTSEVLGLTITKAAAEDNTDPVTKQAISDRLQLTLQNTSAQTMSRLEVYYSMKDAKTGQTENYYQKLTGLQLAPNQTTTISFDSGSGVGHYPENKYSLYRSSQSEVDFTIQVSAPGFKPATANAKKSAGTGETAG